MIEELPCKDTIFLDCNFVHVNLSFVSDLFDFVISVEVIDLENYFLQDRFTVGNEKV